MKFTNFVIIALIFSGCATEESLMDEAFMVGKAELGDVCRHVNAWESKEKALGGNNLIAMDSKACEIPEKLEVDIEDRTLDNINVLDSSCFPDFHEGVIHTYYVEVDANTSHNQCDLVSAPQYWFKGSENSHALKITLNRDARASTVGPIDAWGLGVQLKIVKFDTNGGWEEVDPTSKKEALVPIHEGEIVVVMPYPEELSKGTMDEEHDAPYTIIFSKLDIAKHKAVDGVDNTPIKPDYQIKALNVQKLDEEKAKFEIEVCNAGGISDKEFEVRIYPDLPGVVGEDLGCPAADADSAYFVKETIKGTFYPGNDFCKTIFLETEPLDSGIHSTVAVVDDGCSVDEGEEGEKNNHKFLTFRTGETSKEIPTQSNLVIADLKADVVNNTVHYSIIACNMGERISEPCKIKLWFDRESEPQVNSDSPKADATFDLPALAHKGCTEEPLTAVQKDVKIGTYKAWVLVDADGQNPELQFEKDNTMSDTYEVTTVATETEKETETETETPKKDLPDVYIKDIQVFQTDERATFKVMVCNQGKIAAGEFKVGLFYNVKDPKCGLTPDREWNIASNSLTADGCQPYLKFLTVEKAGTFTASAMADSGCTLDEEKDDNNSLKREYTLELTEEQKAAAEKEVAEKEAAEKETEVPKPPRSDTEKSTTTTPATPGEDGRGTAEFGCQVASTSPASGLGLHVLVLLGMLMGLRRRRAR